MRAPSKRVYTRLSGAGNSFIICNTFPIVSEPLDFEKRKSKARQLCLETDGLNADGFICLDPSQKTNFKWDFYNSDGSHAEMCGNAARCVALYYYHKINQVKKITFESSAGIIEADVLNTDENIVKILMPEISDLNLNKSIQIAGKKIRGFFINTGVPHFIVQQAPDLELAKKIRGSLEFGENGTNVTFVDFDDSDYVYAVTFERGVEGFTLSCGTGAVAAAMFYHLIHQKSKEIFVEMPGGILSVDLSGARPYLVGSVEIHFDFSIYEDVI